jgi:hypothetical protein
MELISFGDRLEPGVYTLHSRFEKVVNLNNEEKIISIVSREIGGGPINIMFSDKVFCNAAKVRIEVGSISMGSQKFSLDHSKVYSSGLGLTEINRVTFIRGINVLRECIIAKQPHRSIVFLLEENDNSTGISNFDFAVQRRIRSGWEHLQRGDIEGGTSLLIGSGYGLTPAGDDFLTGYLSGLYLEERYFEKKCSHIRDRIFSWSVKTNLLSRTFIRFAYEGCFYEHSKSLISAVAGGSSKVIERSFEDMLTIGETSGADFMVGLLCTFI